MLDDFSRVLRFKAHLSVLDAGPDTLFIVDETRRSVLRGAVYVSIAACLRESMTIAQTIATLSARFSDWQVLAVLDHLERQAYLRSDEPDERDAARGFFERTGLNGDRACEQLAQLRVAVEAFGIDPAPQKRALAACGIDLDHEAPFVIALVDSYARRELAEVTERVLARGGSVLVVMPYGIQPLIGPLLGPKDIAPDAPCITCLRYWTSLNQPVQTLLARHHGDEALRVAPAHTRASVAAVSAFAAALIQQIAVSEARREQARRHILSYRIDTSTTASHRVVRRPQCPRCGNPHWMQEQAIRAPILRGKDVLASREGGFRSIEPQGVLKRYGHLVSPVSGAIAYLHPMPGRHAGLRNVYVAGYLVCPPGIPRTNRFDRVCSGKGRTDEHARVSALCEAIERFSGVYQGDEMVVRASMQELRSGDASGGGSPIAVNELQQFSESQFARRDAINALTEDVRKQVPQRFSGDDIMDWTPAWSLNTGMRHWVPLSYCFADTPDSAEGLTFCVHNPNGSAAGSCVEEAILQGLLELVERDATAIWWYNQVQRPAVDISSFRDPYFDALFDEYESMGWRLWALDITHDLGIPVIVALAENPTTGRFSIGFGCHLDSRIALQRALTEVNQLLDVTADAPPPWDAAKLSSKQFLYPGTDQTPVDSTAHASIDARELKDAIKQCVGRLYAAGMEVLVVDKTRPDLGLPVVQVIVPGLCHFWPRFGAARLYSVPVKLRWLSRAHSEEELNQALLFL